MILTNEVMQYRTFTKVKYESEKVLATKVRMEEYQKYQSTT